jgi:hypothetical protein
MPTWLKVLLIVALVVVLLIAGVVVGGAVWWSRNKDALISQARELVTEGKDLGRETDNQGCVDQSIARYKKDPGFKNAVSTSIFMRACLDESRPTPGFCDEVPKETEFIKSGRWRVEQCRRVDLAGDSYCQNLFQPVQQFCQHGARKSY